MWLSGSHPRALCLVLPAATAAVGALLAVLVSATQAASTPSAPALTITSPSICLSSFECPSSQFCNQTFDSVVPPHCVPRIPVDEPCSAVGTEQCQAGAFCFFSQDSSDQVCFKQLDLDDACDTSATSPCKAPLICSSDTLTCRPFARGRRGDPCQFDRHCQQDEGFYCRTEDEVCAQKLPPGSTCGVRSDNNECLRGFCQSAFGGPSKCLSEQPTGSLCTETIHCARPFAPAPRDDVAVCNVARGETVGRCVARSALLRALGAPCDPANDACDMQRGLACRARPFSRLEEFICQHRVRDRRVTTGFSYCAPNTTLSRCPWGAEATACRLPRERPPPRGLREWELFGCRRQVEVAHLGRLCTPEHVRCVDSHCRVIRGVRQEDLGFRPSRFPPTRTSFCVVIVPKGGDCSSKFSTACDDGLDCKAGTCVDGVGRDDPAWRPDVETFAGSRADCSDLPCVPGLECRASEDGESKTCQLRRVVVKEGHWCGETARRERVCPDGLVCMLNAEGRNRNRCRRKKKAGEFCEMDDHCKHGLKCAMLWPLSRRAEQSVCYDPSAQLALGDPCDPNDVDRRCVEVEVADGPPGSSPSSRAMRCSLVVGSASDFRCQVDASSFNDCDVSKNVICEDERFYCADVGFCLPK